MPGDKKITTFANQNAVVAQLVEHQLPKLRVAGSSPVNRSKDLMGCRGDGYGCGYGWELVADLGVKKKTLKVLHFVSFLCSLIARCCTKSCT